MIKVTFVEVLLYFSSFVFSRFSSTGGSWASLSEAACTAAISSADSAGSAGSGLGMRPLYANGGGLRANLEEAADAKRNAPFGCVMTLWDESIPDSLDKRKNDIVPVVEQMVVKEKEARYYFASVQSVVWKRVCTAAASSEGLAFSLTINIANIK